MLAVPGTSRPARKLQLFELSVLRGLQIPTREACSRGQILYDMALKLRKAVTGLCCERKAIAIRKPIIDSDLRGRNSVVECQLPNFRELYLCDPENRTGAIKNAISRGQ